MNRLNRTPIDTKAYGEILVSLGLAMEQAGGGVDYSNLDNMTAVGLLKLLAPNHIRFSYCQPNQPKPEPLGDAQGGTQVAPELWPYGAVPTAPPWQS